MYELDESYVLITVDDIVSEYSFNAKVKKNKKICTKKRRTIILIYSNR